MHHCDVTFSVVEAVGPKNDVHLSQLQHLGRELTPGQSYDFHPCQVVGMTAALTVIEAVCEVTGVRQGDMGPQSARQHPW